MIRVAQSHLAVAAQTHPGMSGKNNEDRYAVSAFQLETRKRTPALFAVIADGIGGHRAGEVAAEIAVESISRGVAQSSGDRPLETLKESIQGASQEIFRQAETDPARLGMGATCACVWVIGNRLYTAALGDSRIYLMRGGSIHQVSRDHTWVQEAIERGIIRPEQARGHPNAHVIRRYLGGPNPPPVDFGLRVKARENDRSAAANQGLELREGDRLLLCSDGLTDLVEDAEVMESFQKYSLEGAVQALTELANQRGGHDNITLVAIEARRGAFRQPVSPLRIFFMGLSMLLLAAAITLWWFFGPQTVNSLLGGSQQTVTAPTLNFSITSAPPVTQVPVIMPPTTSVAPASTQTPQGYPYPPALSSPTASLLTPAEGGPTLTPWPTNTLEPTQKPTLKPTLKP
jgi:serine/threonine protein phosphatase PrpC